MTMLFVSDAELDRRYDEAMRTNNFVMAQDYATEIVSRIGVWDFVQSAVAGATDFPLYEKWTKFGGKDAQVSIKQAASATGAAIVETAGQVSSVAADTVLAVLKGAWPLLLLGGGVYYVARRKKRA